MENPGPVNGQPSEASGAVPQGQLPPEGGNQAAFVDATKQVFAKVEEARRQAEASQGPVQNLGGSEGKLSSQEQQDWLMSKMSPAEGGSIGTQQVNEAATSNQEAANQNEPYLGGSVGERVMKPTNNVDQLAEHFARNYGDKVPDPSKIQFRLEQYRDIFARVEKIFAKLTEEDRGQLAEGVTEITKAVYGESDTSKLEPKARMSAQEISDWLMGKMT